MLVGFAWLLTLLVLWLDLRLAGEAELPARTHTHPGAADAVALLAVIGAHLPLATILDGWRRLPAFLPGDARTHALVAQHVFGEALRTGWSDVYVGGFPLALHYPIVGSLVLGLPMTLGLEPTLAVRVVGTTALVGTSLLFYVAARLHRVHVMPALAAALVFPWIAPLNPFVGGFESFFITGLMSQVLVMPLLLGWLFAVFGRRSLAVVSLLACLSFLTHPQVAFAATLLLGLSVVVYGRRSFVARFVCSAALAGLVSLFVYGPGMLRLHLPFGWPVNPTWMHLGFGPERLSEWFVDGDLLDNHRSPVLTALWLASATLAAARLRYPAARAVLVASAGLIVLSVSGPPLAASGKLGAILLSALQPLRAMALYPVVVSATIAVALELHRDTLGRVLNWLVTRTRPLCLAQRPTWLKLGLALFIGFPIAWQAYRSRANTTNAWREEFRAVPADLPCGPLGPTREQLARLHETLRSLRLGRLWFDDSDGSLPARCALSDGFERHSGIPFANTRGLGAHVGFLSTVNAQLSPSLPGLASRAESLGIRYVLLGFPLEEPMTAGFERVGSYGPLHLYARVGGSDLFGAGCVRERWSGANAKLASDLTQRLASGLVDEIAAPTSLKELTFTSTSVRREVVRDHCASDAAVFSNESHSVGRHRVAVDTRTPTDVVLRVTAFPSWHWRVNGRAAAPRLVLPGYYSVRLPPGRHTVDVTHRFSGMTLLGSLMALLGPLVVSRASKLRWFRTRCGSNAPASPSVAE